MATQEQVSCGYSIVVAEDDANRLVCRTPGFAYTPDTMRYVYGKSKRRPLEDWFLDELAFFRGKYPNHDIFTVGSSCVFGERFVNYLTICEFELASEEAFTSLKRALRESDQAIRRKFHAMWKWNFAAKSGRHIVFMVGFMDLAYFLQHREDFLGEAHGRYMGSFIADNKTISSTDYKVLQDGSIVLFDPARLSPDDKFVYDHNREIQFELQKL